MSGWIYSTCFCYCELYKSCVCLSVSVKQSVCVLSVCLCPEKFQEHNHSFHLHLCVIPSFLGRSCFTSTRFMPSVDRTIVQESIPSFVSSICMMFGSYYSFNIHYPSKLASTLEFLQRYVILDCSANIFSVLNCNNKKKVTKVAWCGILLLFWKLLYHKYILSVFLLFPQVIFLHKSWEGHESREEQYLPSTLEPQSSPWSKTFQITSGRTSEVSHSLWWWPSHR